MRRIGVGAARRSGFRGIGGGTLWTPAALGSKLTGWWGKLGVSGTSGSDTVDVVDADGSGTINALRDLGYTTGAYARDANRDLVQATDNLRPDIISVLGRSVAQFDRVAAAEDTMSAAAASSTFIGANNGVLAVAYNPASVALNSGTSYGNDPLVYGSTQYWGMYMATSGLWVHCFDTNDEPIQFAGRGVSTGTPHVALLAWDSAAGHVRGYCDGLTVSLETGFVGLGSTGGVLKAGAINASQDSAVTIYEIVTASSATAAEEVEIVRYLANRWGVTLS